MSQTENATTLRPATTSDIKRIVDWYIDLLHHGQKSNDPVLCSVSDEAARAGIELHINSVIVGPDQFIQIAEVNGEPVGFVHAATKEPFAAGSVIGEVVHIDAIWVQEEARGKGSAAALVKCVEDWAQELHIEYVELAYLVLNAAAEGFWKAIGYEPYRMFSRKKVGE